MQCKFCEVFRSFKSLDNIVIIMFWFFQSFIEDSNALFEYIGFEYIYIEYIFFVWIYIVFLFLSLNLRLSTNIGQKIMVKLASDLLPNDFQKQ